MIENLVTGLLSGVIAFIVAWFTSRRRIKEFISQREYEEESKIREVANKYTGVILLAATDLQDRLWHLCQRQSESRSPVLLAENPQKPMRSSWPMTKEHYLVSTLYLFAQYFCWIEILKIKTRFLDLGEDKKTNEFNYHLKRIERSLAEADLQMQSEHEINTDQPLFQFYQTEIGQSVIKRTKDEIECMSFFDFSQNYSVHFEDVTGFIALSNLLIGAVSKKKADFCLSRLRLMANALVDLIYFLNSEQNLIETDLIEKVSVSNYDEAEYLKKWPATFNGE